MTSRNESTPIKLKTLEQQGGVASRETSSEEVRLRPRFTIQQHHMNLLITYLTYFILHILVSQGFGVGYTQRGAGCCWPWICAWIQHAVVAYKLQLLAFIVSLRRATNVPPSLILIKALESDAAITQN